MSPLTRKIGREIGRRRGQFAAIVLSAFLGTALFGASFDAWRNLQASYDRVFSELAMADYTLAGGVADLGARVATTDGVAVITEREVAETALRVGDRAIAARLVGYPSAPPPALDRLRLSSGTLPLAADEVVVEQHLADALGLAPGAHIEIGLATGWQPVAVSGVAVSPEYLWPARSRQEILVAPDQWGVLFVPPEMVSRAPAGATIDQLLIGYSAGADRSALDGQLAGVGRESGATDAYSRAEQPSNAALREDIDGFGELSLMFPMLFLGAAGMAIYVLLGRLVRSQQPEIGVLLALGLTRRRVVGHYLAFGLLAAVAGGIPGAVAGVALGGLVTSLYTGTLGIPTRVVNLYPETPLLAIGFAVVAGALGALAPALQAARLTPAEAMRGSRPPIGHGSLAERLLPPLRRLPERWKLVLRGIGRSRGRSLATIAGIILAITLVLTSWGLLDTVQLLTERQFDTIERQQFVAQTLAPVTPGQLAAVVAIDGVAAAEPVAQLPVGLSGPAGSYGTTLVAFPATTHMHTFIAPNGSALELPAQGLLVGDALRDRLGVAAGDQLTISLPDGQRVGVPLAGFVHEPLGTYAYASRDFLETALGSAGGDAQPRSIYVLLAAGASPSATKQALQQLAGVQAVVDSDVLRHLLDQYLGIFYVFVGVMFVLGALLAFALIYATISANVAERSVELANLRAVGMSAGQIGRLISAENLVLTTIGVIPGLIVGYLGAAEFMAAFSSDLFAFDLQVRPLSFVMAAGAAFVAVAVSLLPTLRAVARVDLGRVVRERAT